MNLGKNIDGLINGGGAFLSPQEIVSKCKNGRGSDFFIVNVTTDPETYDGSLDKNYNEITNAFISGKTVVCIPYGETLAGASEVWLLRGYGYSVDEYRVNIGSQEYYSDSATGILATAK